MELIEEYRHGPPLADGSYNDEEASGDATFGSHTALPAPRQRGIGRWLPWRADTSPSGPGDHSRYLPRKKPRRSATALGVAGWIGAALALVAAGAVVGFLVSMPGTASPSSRASTPAGGVQGGALPPPPGQQPPAAFPPIPAGHTAVLALQTFGDSYTVFLLHGVGWIPQTQVTVTLAGQGLPSVRRVVDDAGTFNCAIGQGYDFFTVPIPPGFYKVVVTGAGRRHASATFQVRPPQPPPPAPSPTP
jgi:hypothetical protein